MCPRLLEHSVHSMGVMNVSGKRHRIFALTKCFLCFQTILSMLNEVIFNGKIYMTYLDSKQWFFIFFAKA